MADSRYSRNGALFLRFIGRPICIYIYIFKTVVIHEDRKEERWSEIDFQSLEFDVVVTNGIKRANRLCPR